MVNPELCCVCTCMFWLRVLTWSFFSATRMMWIWCEWFDDSTCKSSIDESIQFINGLKFMECWTITTKRIKVDAGKRMLGCAFQNIEFWNLCEILPLVQGVKVIKSLCSQSKPTAVVYTEEGPVLWGLGAKMVRWSSRWKWRKLIWEDMDDYNVDIILSYIHNIDEISLTDIFHTVIIVVCDCFWL